ncbi:hypothetical protein IT417_00440 [bacterium]|nr:hypothetical protein [bacterium]
MKYLLTQAGIAVLSVILLLYFFSLSYFVPLEQGNINWYNVVTVLFLVFFFVESVVATIILLIEKFLTCGWKEFPHHSRSLKWGIGIGFCAILAMILSMYNVLPIFYGFTSSAIILYILNILKVF